MEGRTAALLLELLHPAVKKKSESQVRTEATTVAWQQRSDKRPPMTPLLLLGTYRRALESVLLTFCFTSTHRLLQPAGKSEPFVRLDEEGAAALRVERGATCTATERHRSAPSH